jgi:hypothetical protein
MAQSERAQFRYAPAQKPDQSNKRVLLKRDQPGKGTGGAKRSLDPNVTQISDVTLHLR